MRLFIITEIVENEEGFNIYTMTNHVRDEKQALEIFEARTKSLVESKNTDRVLVQQYNPKECWGLTKVDLDSGYTIEMSMMEATLV